jgi:glutathione synthase/RimK-type ligase-like ATP-grasp enzyme
MAVLIFSMPGDLHTAAVEWSLKRKGVAVDKIFLSDFPQKATISCTNAASEIQFHLDARTLRYRDYDTIWFRRISSAVPGDDLVASDAAAARRSWGELSRFLVEFPRHHGAFCLNPSESYATRDNKPLQLYLASTCGLAIPDTLIGTHPGHLEQFVTRNRAENGETIVKPLVPTMWQRDDGAGLMLAVSLVTQEDLAEADISSEPLIFQRRVQKAYEVRLTVMGRTMFAVKLDSQRQSSTELDFRNAADWRVLGHELVEVPGEIQQKVELLCERLRTPFGTMDFIVTTDGEWIFLETNTMGNFLWMEDCNPDVPLLDCFTEFLISRDPLFEYAPGAAEAIARFAEFQSDREFLRSLENEASQHVEFKPPFMVTD